MGLKKRRMRTGQPWNGKLSVWSQKTWNFPSQSSKELIILALPPRVSHILLLLNLETFRIGTQYSIIHDRHKQPASQSTRTSLQEFYKNIKNSSRNCSPHECRATKHKLCMTLSMAQSWYSDYNKMNLPPHYAKDDHPVTNWGSANPSRKSATHRQSLQWQFKCKWDQRRTPRHWLSHRYQWLPVSWLPPPVSAMASPETARPHINASRINNVSDYTVLSSNNSLSLVQDISNSNSDDRHFTLSFQNDLFYHVDQHNLRNCIPIDCDYCFQWGRHENVVYQYHFSDQ